MTKVLQHRKNNKGERFILLVQDGEVIRVWPTEREASDVMWNVYRNQRTIDLNELKVDIPTGAKDEDTYPEGYGEIAIDRISLHDGKWFNAEDATVYDEDTFWDGNNHISLVTGSQWEHQALFHTRLGNWVLHEYNAQGREGYNEIDIETAIDWLIRNSQWQGVPESVIAEREV